MRIPDINLKCPAGPHTRRCSRAMAHRRGLLRGKVTLAVMGTLVLSLLLAGSVFVSNQTTGLRSNMADLESQRDYLEAGTGQLLTQWKAATCTKVITRRASEELGLVLQDQPGLVLVCRDHVASHGGGDGWRRFLSRFGGGGSAQAAEDKTGLVAGSMISLTPRNSSQVDAP